MKITPTMRRMVRDAEFREAVAALIEAQDRLRTIEHRNADMRRNANRPIGIDHRLVKSGKVV